MLDGASCRNCGGYVTPGKKHVCLDIKIKQLMIILRRCEWCKWDGVDFVSYKCPYCGNYKQQGHMAGCELAKELAA